MPGAAPGFGKELSAGYRKNNPGVTETSNTFPTRKNIGNPVSDAAHKVGENLGRRGAAQLESKQRAAGKKTMPTVAPAVKKGRTPSGKRAAKHNVRRG